MKRGTRAHAQKNLFQRYFLPRKRSQMKLSFGMIFSIILIIIFLAFGFYVISKFLDMKSSVEVGKFVDTFQNDVTKMWSGSQGSQEEEYTLPTKVGAICFVDFSSSSRDNEDIYKKLRQAYDNEQNFFFYPVGSGNGLDAITIEHINLEKITEAKNPFCIETDDGKIKLTIKKNFNDALVCIGENCESESSYTNFKERNNDREEKNDEENGSVKITVSESYCQRAENEDICNWLNLGFGGGYEESCCSEHDLCC